MARVFFTGRKHLTAIAAGVVCFSSAASALADGLKLNVAEKAPPAEVDASIRATLQTKAVQLLEGDKPVFEFWFRSEVPLASKPASAEKALDALQAPTLIGVVSLHSERRDYRDNPITAGIHTMRFALQPQNGDHLGTADFNYFLVLVPIKRDPKLDGIGDFKALVKASSADTSTEHPVIISLRPVSDAAGELPALTEPAADHKAVRVKLAGKTAGGDKADLVFDLVYQGKGNLQ